MEGTCEVFYASGRESMIFSSAVLDRRMALSLTAFVS